MNQIKKNISRIIIFIFVLITVTLHAFYGSIMAYDEFPGPDEAMDIVLLLDESGSMRINDPQDLRKDAAKLFVELNELLAGGSRVSVAGFGENTNIYIDPTGVSQGKAEIIEAIENIRSNQKYTDIKLALEEIDSMLRERTVKNKTIIVILTDGKLDTGDIPIPEDVLRDIQDGQEKPSPPGKEEKEIEKNETKSSDITNNDNGESTSGADNIYGDSSSMAGSGTPEEQYLKDYKDQLLNLCYQYRQNGIKLYPIAFTGEANLELLTKMAAITGASSLKASSPADIRDVFLEIFRHITDGFIMTRDQKGSDSIKGIIEIDDYIDKMILIAARNEMKNNPAINLKGPSGESANLYNKEIKDDAYIIGVIDDPAHGKWSYELDGDMVVVLDMAGLSLIEPSAATYPAGTGIPIIIEIVPIRQPFNATDFSGFCVTCDVQYPDGNVKNGIMLEDNGKDPDEVAGDGKYGYLLMDTGTVGEYHIEFNILHVPTGCFSMQESGFIVNVPGKLHKTMHVRVVNNIIAGTSIPVTVNFDDFSKGDFSYILTGPDAFRSGGVLYDDGNMEHGDNVKDDGVYNILINDFDIMGEYTIKISGSFEAEDGTIFNDVKQASFNKYLELTGPEVLDIGDSGELQVFTINAVSGYPEDLSIALGSPESGQETVLDKLEIVSENNVLKAGSSMDITIGLKLKDELSAGKYDIRVPVIIGDAYKKDINLEINYQGKGKKPAWESVTGLSLVFLSIVPLGFLLFSLLNLDRLRMTMTGPWIIAESVLFLVLLAAGLIVLFI
ncbi:MAG: VWA domain-containing protein [Actinobacteria bacterium]|nr:VWA domain-containing protein [Actinomycetota bacterium]